MIPPTIKVEIMSEFLTDVIDCLKRDYFLRNHRNSYCYFDYCMDRDADKIRPFTEGWQISTFDCAFFTSIELKRGQNTVPLTWKEKRRLLKVFRSAMDRLRIDRKAFLKSLRD